MKSLPRSKTRSAFTLVEILIVISILVVLAGLLFPVFARARRQSQIASGWNRMRQTTVALQLYAQDNNDERPDVSVARRVVPLPVQCHPLDDWQPNCLVRNEPLLLGSWGYTKSDPEPRFVEPSKETWIVNVFAVDEPMMPVFRYRTSPDDPCVLNETCFVQERIECMGSDSALRVVKRKQRKKFQAGPYMVFDWNTAFDLCRGATELQPSN